MCIRDRTKIRDLEKENSKNSDTCQSSARESFTKEANEFESLLLARDNEISLMKIENSKMRRANDKLQGNFASQLKLVAQLQSQVKKLSDDQVITKYEAKIADLQRNV